MATGMPTLMDFNFGAQRERIKAQNQMNFEQEFLEHIQTEAYKVSPNLSWDGANLSFTPGVKPFSKEGLWNEYKRKAESYKPPLKVDVMRFEQELWPMYSAAANSKFQEQLGTLQMMGIPEEKWEDLYRKNPEYGAALRSSIQNETDPAKVQAMSSYIPEAEGEGLVESMVENPLAYGGAGLLSFGVGKGLTGMLKKAKFKGAGTLRTALGQGLPMLGASFTGDLAGMLGASDFEQDVAQTLGTGGAAAYYGITGASNMLRDNLAGGLVTTDDMAKLKQRAQALGINEVDGRSTADARTKIDNQKLKSSIVNKVQGQNYRTSSALLKAANIKPKGGSAGLAKSGLSKLGGKMSLGLGLLTTAQLLNLAKGLFDSDDRKPFESPLMPQQINPYREIPLPEKGGK